MSKSTIDYVNPSLNIGKLHKEGLSYVVNCMGTSSSSSSVMMDCDGEEMVQQLINCTVSYLKGALSMNLDITEENSLKTTLANAVNGYLDGGTSGSYSNYLSVPVDSMPAMFYRVKQQLNASAHLKGNTTYKQATLEIAESNYNYWRAEINSAASPWQNFFSGNLAIDLSNIPFWVSAAAFGANFNMDQINSWDSRSIDGNQITYLGGSIVVGAGILMFKWVPKNQKHSRNNINQPPISFLGPINIDPITASNYGIPIGAGSPDPKQQTSAGIGSKQQFREGTGFWIFEDFQYTEVLDVDWEGNRYYFR